MSETESDSTSSDRGQKWNAEKYDSAHSFVWKHGAGILELLDPTYGERILDLGSGTGHLTHQIAERGAEVIGIDTSPTMIEQARRNYPDVRFEYGDGADFSFPEPFDAVFSNAAIHWMRPPNKVAACIWRALRPGGRMVVEFGGKGNIEKLHGAIKRAVEKTGYSIDEDATYRYYPSIGEFASLLESVGFHVAFASHFDRPTPLDGGEEGLAKWLEVFGAAYFSAVPPAARPEIIRTIEVDLHSDLKRGGTWYADYKRIRTIAIRP